MHKRLGATCLMFVFLATGVASAAQRIEVCHFDQFICDWYKEQAELYNELNPDVEVVVTMYPSLFALEEAVMMRAIVEDPPDIVDGLFRSYHIYADLGLLADLRPFLENSKTLSPDYFFPGLLEMCSYGGKLFLAPSTVGSVLTLFNGAFFHEAGLPTPMERYFSGTWSWDTALDDARKLVIADGGIVTRWGWDPTYGVLDWGFGSYIYSNGGSILSDDLTTSLIHEEPAVTALEFLTDVYVTWRVGDIANQSFHLGMGTRTAMGSGVLFHLKTIWEQRGLETLGVAPIAPSSPDLPPAGVVNAGGPIIFDKDGNVQAAWDFLEFTMRPEGQVSFIDHTGRLSGRRDMLDYWMTPSAVFVGGPEAVQVIADSITYGRTLPFGVHYPEVRDLLTEALREMFSGHAPPQTRAISLTEQINGILKKYH